MIAMFDSGLGGLSIWQAVSRTLPQWPITYLADQAYCPYGGRSQEEIVARSVQIGRFLADQGASILVVACNTATTAAVAALRKTLDIPVVGVEPAIKPAASMSRTGRIAVLATQATLASARVQALQNEHAGHVEVLRCPGTGWVEQVEAGDLDSDTTRQLVHAVISPLLNQNIDYIALGCTHYPFLAPLIRELTGDSIHLYNPAEAIARRVASQLDLHHIAPPPPQQAHRFYTTAPDASTMSAPLPALIGQPYPVTSIALEQNQPSPL